MASEVDSFVLKFKNLWKSGRNVKLTMEVNAGKANVTLCVLDLECPPYFLPPSKRSRNKPAQQRRRERRAKERQVAAEATEASKPAEEAKKSNEAEKAANLDEKIEKATEEKLLILDLDNGGKDKNVEEAFLSPIPQMDGQAEGKEVIYKFVSGYGEEDILYTLEELFPAKNADLVSRVQLRPLSAEHQCTVALSLTAGQTSGWPEMIGIQAEVCKELRRVK